MFDKVKIEFEGDTVELNARRMPHSMKGKLFDKLVNSRKDGIPSTEVLANNRTTFICSTFVDDNGKPLFKPGYPADESTWGDESVLRQYPELWEPNKFVAYAKAAEAFQAPKLEDVAKNFTATTNDDSSSASP